MKLDVLQKAMIDAMKAHDKARKDSISTLVSAVKKVGIDETCPESRAELKSEYEARLAVFEEFAPKMLSEEEVEAIIREKFADVLATGNKGQIMKAVMGELKGKADGKLINGVVAKLTK